MFRRYNRWHARFDQPDPYEGSYSLTDPQSLNRYAYVRNDPINLIDPTGLLWACTQVDGGPLFCEYEPGNPLDPGRFGGGGIIDPRPGGGGAGGGDPGKPQDPAKPSHDKDNDCWEFANLVAQIAQEWTKNNSGKWRYDASGFKNALAARFTPGIIGAEGTGEFRDSGYKTDYKDGSDQVRHYVFAFRMGFNRG